MTILPAKRQNSGNNEETEENTQSSQQIPIGINISPSRHHNSLQIGLNLSPGHGQLLKHQHQETNERQLWTRHEELQHARPTHNQHNTFEEAPSSSKRRTYAYSSIPNAKERYYRNLERKRIREQKQERERARERDLEQKIDCELKLDLISNPASSTGQASDNRSDENALSLQQREEGTGYNSEDEYSEHPSKKLTEEEWRQRDLIFARSLEKRGFIIKPMVEDGACLFRAIADQVYGDQEMHSVVRTHCMDYILKNRDFYCAYVTEDFNKYVSRKRHDFVHGNHLEIQALSEMYHRSIEVYCYQLKPINIFHGAQKSDYEPIRLSYQRASHYNSITNPFNPSVGVGLGLPSYVLPNEIDRRQVNDAVRQSEDLLIEQTMMEDKLKATDWEATNEVIEEQVARESYLQWCKDNEKRRKQLHANCSSVAGSSSTITSAQSCSPRASCTTSRSSASSSRSGAASPRSGGTSPRSGGASPRSGAASPRTGGAGPRSPKPRGSSSPQTSHGSPRASVRSPGVKNSPIPEDTCSSSIAINDIVPSSSSSSQLQNGEPTVTAKNFCETDSIFSRLPPEVFGLKDWEDAGVMARVLAASQQEYLDNLKAARHQQRHYSPGPSTSSER